MRSILQRVLERAERQPDRLCVRTVSRRTPAGSRSWSETAEGARRAAHGWRARGVEPGDLVVLIGTHHLDLYACWLGAVWAGAVPTVLAEPSVRIDPGVYWRRLGALLEHNRARHLAIDPRYFAAASAPELGALECSTYEQLASAPTGAEALAVPSSAPDDLLLLQHSSGTTGLHKGVMLSHGAVLRHAEAYGAVLEMDEHDVVASWLPLYHDMGLIACFVMPLLFGTPVIWLSPFEWVANPGLLLEAVSDHRASLLWLPNFAFTFLAERARAASDDLDLSSLRAVINCSEPVTTEALQSFARRFATAGLRDDALHACYAMAENVFAVTTTSPSRPLCTLSIARTAWESDHLARPMVEGEEEEEPVRLVSSGVAVTGCRIRIVGDAGEVLPPLHAGRITIHSSFLFDGYYRRPDLDAGLFTDEGFYDTGDLGFVDADGHLYVTGRSTDLIIVGGRNVYPQEVEAVAAVVEGVKPGRVVCFGVPIAGLGTEGLVLLAESEEPEERWPEIQRRLRAIVPQRLDLDLFDARIQPPGRLLKSTSGKLARTGNRDWYLEGRFGPSQTKGGGSR